MVECLGISPFHFYKVSQTFCSARACAWDGQHWTYALPPPLPPPSPRLCQILEPIIKEEAGLTREMVKHLAQVEEMVLEYLAWLSESPLFDAIDAAGKVPTFEEVHPFVVPTTPLANRGGPPFSSRIPISPLQSNPRLGVLQAARGRG